MAAEQQDLHITYIYDFLHSRLYHVDCLRVLPTIADGTVAATLRITADTGTNSTRSGSTLLTSGRIARRYVVAPITPYNVTIVSQTIIPKKHPQIRRPGRIDIVRIYRR